MLLSEMTTCKGISIFRNTGFSRINFNLIGQGLYEEWDREGYSGHSGYASDSINHNKNDGSDLNSSDGGFILIPNLFWGSWCL